VTLKSQQSNQRIIIIPDLIITKKENREKNCIVKSLTNNINTIVTFTVPSVYPFFCFYSCTFSVSGWIQRLWFQTGSGEKGLQRAASFPCSLRGRAWCLCFLPLLF